MVNKNEFELLQYKAGGHLPGGIYRHKATGEKFLLKIPNNENEAKNEILAAKLYQLLDVKIANLEMIEFNEQIAIVSQWVEGYKNLGYDQIPSNVNGLYENFVIDAWLANWDLVGLENDNIGFVDNVEAIRIDLGGSLLYRGMGALKGEMFTKHAPEICSMLDFERNYNAASVFKDTTVKHFLDAAERIAQLADIDIENLVIEYAPGDHEQKIALFTQLLERRDDLTTKAIQLEASDPQAYLKVELCGMGYDSLYEL